MSPIEVFWITLTFIFCLLGAARGYPKELGVTTMALVGIFMLEQFLDNIISFFDAQIGPVIGIQIQNRPDSNLWLFVIYAGLFLAIVFASYAGRTFAFEGKPAGGRIGTLLNLGVGLFNGYLINGTLWHYLDKYGYPVQRWGLVRPELTPLAQEMVQYLPPRVFSGTLLIGMVGLLLLLRVYK